MWTFRLAPVGGRIHISTHKGAAIFQSLLPERYLFWLAWDRYVLQEVGELAKGFIRS